MKKRLVCVMIGISHIGTPSKVERSEDEREKTG